MSHTFHITTGDLDGIGLEVTLKALPKIVNKSSQCQFVIWVHTSQEDVIKSFISKHKSLISKTSFLKSIDKNHVLKKFNFLLNSKKTPATWFEHATQICLTKGDAVITAPLSKTQIAKEGFKAIGHTEILRDITRCTDLKMAFVGQYFSMILYTGHIPVAKVKYEKQSFDRFLESTYKFHTQFKNKNSSYNILGLNPHAGDSGLIGDDDEKILHHVKAKYKIQSLIPADSAFIDYKKFKHNPTFISLYHDQGLIPFKMAHGFTGFHFTLGLPFVRTSVDHGTAKNIFNQNKANSTSMVDAILGAIKLKKSS